MIPWVRLGSTTLENGTLTLSRRGDEYAIRLGGAELMNSRAHHSEDMLAVRGCANAPRAARVLVGGLGMGFTTRAALDVLGPEAIVEVAELVPEVVAWNRGPLAELAGRPLDDPRVTLRAGDVANLLDKPERYDAILFDVDNGPGAFTAPSNARLYGQPGLRRAFRALRPGGAFAVWSVDDDRGFIGRLRSVGFQVKVERVTARPTGGARHVLWIAHRAVDGGAP